VSNLADAVRSFVAADPLRAYAAVLEIDGGGFKKKGGEFYTRCCFHDDEHPSFRINLTKNVWRCDSCGFGGDIFDLYGLRENLGRGNFPQKVSGLAKLLGINGQAVARHDGSPGRSRIIATYDYRDDKDELVYQVVRYDPKDFRQRRPDGNGGWIWNLDGVHRVLFGLQPLLAADPAETIFIVEGEKDALNLQSAGCVATTCAGGAGKWRPEYNDPLRARHVAVLPDNDDPGREHARLVAESLSAIAASVKVVELPGLPPKGDVSDWLDAGGNRGKLLELVEATSAVAGASGEGGQDQHDVDGHDQRDVERLLLELAALSRLEYERCREQMAKRLDIRVSALDAEVAARRGEPGARAPADAGLLQSWVVEPWPSPVSDAELLDELAAVFSRFVVLPAHGAETLALWVLHAWAHDAATISPLVVLISPEKQCGKTTVCILLRYIVPRPLVSSNVTAPVVFRAVDRWRPTLLIDEVDTFLPENDELRGILNSGHVRAMAQTIRCVGDEHEPQTFSTWAPKALALIGRLHDTLNDRSIILKMRRRLPSEHVERLRGDRDAEFLELRRRAARWAADSFEVLRVADPKLPDGLGNRSADNWRPLVAIADLAGGEWPALARAAALGLSGEAEDDSARAVLLADLRDFFGKSREPLFSSAALVEHLVKLEERPWPEWSHGKPLTARQLAKLLRPFRIEPKSVRLSEKNTPKGYAVEDFEDAFARYLPSLSATPPQTVASAAFRDSRSATAGADVADEKRGKPLGDNSCGGVADRNPGEAGEVGDEAEWMA
jgi:putative DNA primase/helicase